MKNELWVVILVVAVFMGFMMGYSLPPMFEAGMIGVKSEQGVGVKPDANKDMQEYYRQLQKATE